MSKEKLLLAKIETKGEREKKTETEKDWNGQPTGRGESDTD